MLNRGWQKPGLSAWGAALILLLVGSTGQAQGGGPGQRGPFEATPQRPTFTSDASTTAPGSLEFEIGPSFSGGFFALPVVVKFTPDVNRSVFRQTEFSLSFDAVSSNSAQENRVTQFGDRLGLTIRRPVYQGTSLSLAVAPRATFFLRGDRGARLGVTGILVYGFGLNGVVLNATWTSATSPSPSNPAQQYDVAVDFVRTLGSSGPLSRWSVFGGALTENPASQPAAVSLAQGVTYRVRPHWVLDVAVVEQGLAAGPSDYQILAGFTVNVGRFLRW